MSQITIRPFQPLDARQVAELILTIQRHEFEISISLDDQPDLTTIPEFYQTGNGNFWVAVANGSIIGTVALKDIGNAQVALRKMFVHPSFRGGLKGAASGLMNELLVWCTEHCVSDIYLGTTAKFLAAHRFYEKNGFEEIEKIALPVRFPVMSVDSKFFRRRLAPSVQPGRATSVATSECVSKSDPG